jgi:hypothetical protein
MIATTITYLAAQEHVNDLRRDADRDARAAQIRSPRRVRLAIPRLPGRRPPRAATV